MTGLSQLPRLFLLIVWIGYAGILALGVLYHEPWFDEAQAWLLARDSRPLQLINEHLRYEGSPGLWHFILSVMAKSGLPYLSMQILAAGLALAGVLLFLYAAPFPWPIRIIFPFSYFILYQYALVARSYALLPLLLFALAALFPRREERPYLYALLLALLAQTSLHGLILAFCFGSMEALSLLRERKLRKSPLIKHSLMALSLLVSTGLFAAWQLRFPEDHSAVHPRPSYDFIFALKFTFQFLSQALTEKPSLSGVILGLSLWHFWKAGVLGFFLVPVFLIGHLFAFVYSSPWHEGILFLLWIFCLWISFTTKNRDTSLTRPPILGALALVLVVQASWAASAFTHDYRYNYSAAKEVAAHLKAQSGRLRTVYATGFHSIAILPYFDKNIFANYQQRYGAAFWDWSQKNTLEKNLEWMVLDRPDAIVHGIKTRFNTSVPNLPGYVATKFSGHIFWKDRIFEEDSFIIYEKIGFEPWRDLVSVQNEKRRRLNSALAR